jgi:C1A family cysteine protease
MLCVGYSDPDRVFIVRNSWGSDWGDKGYCYIPYDYLMSEKYNDGDS